MARLDRPPTAVAPAATRLVWVPDLDAPGRRRQVAIRWLCPVPSCRRPRGEPEMRALTYHDRPSARVRTHWWRNPCGHIDLYRDVLAEAAQLAAHGEPPRGATGWRRPRPAARGWPLRMAGLNCEIT